MRIPMNPSAQRATRDLKMEVASELGLSDQGTMDKGDMSSRENGYVGGYIGGNMTKKMVAFAEEAIRRGNQV